jgi:phospholipid transport system transporter-binding protein
MKRTRKPASAKRTRVVQRRRAVGPLVLAADCLIDSAEALKGELLQRLAQATPVSIDLRYVERIDTAALQVLAAFARDRAAACRQVEWIAVPEAFTDAARLLNLVDLLGLPDEAAAA